MESEKVKEIKKVLEEGQFNTINHHQKEGKPIKISFADILTLINELESENAYQKEHIEMWFRKNEEKKKRIDELEKENGELKQHTTEVEKGIINIARERNKKEELASKFIDSYNDSLKQFAEKLKHKFDGYEATYYNGVEESWHNLQEEIDELLKEYEK